MSCSIVSGCCGLVSFLWCVGNNGAIWGGRGTSLGARRVVGGTGQNTKKTKPSQRRTHAREGMLGLLRTQKKKGASRGDGCEEQRDNRSQASRSGITRLHTGQYPGPTEGGMWPDDMRDAVKFFLDSIDNMILILINLV